MNTGDQLLNYEILAPLGRGGFGTVYLARDVNLEINVALKVMRVEFSESGTMLERLKIGARAAARLRHPNIQTVHFLGRDPVSQIDFVVMEYLAGGTLRQRINYGRLPMAEALATFSTICAALDFAHKRGVIHRDLKPDNIMFDADGRLVVTDFDLARISGESRHTGAGQTLGTLHYISPEQVRGEDVDPTADIYSLGVMLFELTTGRWPFIGENVSDIINGHLYLPPPKPSEFNPNVPAHIDEVVLRALAKLPVERFQSALELATAATGQPVPLQPPAPIAATPPDSLRPTRPVAAAAPPQTPQATLRVLHGKQAGQQFAIGAGVSIGYGKKKNDIHFDDEYVSRAHARIDRQGDVYEVMDLRSTNGTKVNGRKIEPYVPVALSAGDQIEVGSTLLALEV